MAKTKTHPTLRVRLSAKMLALAGLILAGALAVWFMWAGPIRGDVTTFEDKTGALETEIQALTNQLDDIKSGRTEASEAKLDEATHLDELLPVGGDKLTIASDVPKLAKQRGVTLSQLDPIETAPKTASAQTLAFETTATGDTDNVTDFLQALATNTSLGLLTVDDLDLSYSNDGTGTVTFILYAHSAVEPPLVISSPDEEAD